MSHTRNYAEGFPKCHAKTAFGVLRFIKRLILDEPKRYDQCEVRHVQGETDYTPDKGYPLCGTVGCVAGLGSTILFPMRSFASMEAFGNAIGLSIDQQDVLFDGCALITINKTGAQPQTRAYARLGARHIERFIQANIAQLKRTKVKVPR